MNTIEQLHSEIEARRSAVNYTLGGLAVTGASLVLGAIVGAQLLSSQIKSGMLATALSCFATGAALTATESHRKGSKFHQQLEAALGAANKQNLVQELAGTLAQQKVEARLEMMGWTLSQPEYTQAAIAKDLGVEDLYSALYQNLGYQAPTQDWTTIDTGATATVERMAIAPTTPNKWIVNLVAETLHKDREKRQNHHFIVAGGTQEGKSHFIKKFLELTVRGCEHIFPGKGVVINLIDPKYPMSKWGIEPSFIGFDKVGKGVNRAYDVLTQRKKAEIEAITMQTPENDYPFYFVIVDEWELAYDCGKGYANVISDKQAKDIHSKLNILIKEGAAYDIKVILIVQNPDSGKTGFAMNDLGSIAQVVMGATAKRYLSHQAFPFKKFAGEFEAVADEYLEDGKRFAMVINTRGLPTINEFERCEATLNFSTLGTDKTNENDNENVPGDNSPVNEPTDKPPGTQVKTTKPTKDTIPDPWQSRDLEVHLTDHYLQLSRWFNSCLSTEGDEPGDEELKAKFATITGNTIDHADAVRMLREKLRKMIK